MGELFGNFSFNINFTFTDEVPVGPTRHPTPHVFKPSTTDRAVLSVLFSTTGVIGFVYISCMTIAVITEKKLRTRPNILLIDLLISDVLFLLLQCPYGIYTVFVDPPPISKELTMFCDGFILFSYSLGMTNIHALTVISLDRYMAIAHPYFYHAHVTGKCFRILLMWPWLIVFFSILPATLHSGWTGYAGKTDSFCGFYWNKAHVAYVLFMVLLHFFIPMIIIFGTNIKVYSITKCHIQKLCQMSKTSIPNLNFDDCKLSIGSHAESNDTLDTNSELDSTENPGKAHDTKPARQNPDCLRHVSFSNNCKEDSKQENRDALKCDDSHRHSVAIEITRERLETTPSKTSKKTHNNKVELIKCSSLADITGNERPRVVSLIGAGQFEKGTPSESMKNSKLQLRIVISTYCLIAGFIFCWCPFILPRIVSIFHEFLIGRWVLYTAYFPTVAGLLDPLIIISCRKEIRKAFVRFSKSNCFKFLSYLKQKKYNL